MKHRRVFTIGQSVFDILFRNNQPFAAKVGGSMLNTSISLGRLGAEVYFLGEYGYDFAGDITNAFLLENNVKTDYVNRFNDGQTTISLAFLQEDNNAAYNFYRNMPVERLQNEFPDIEKDDIVLFGSFYIFDQAVEEKILPFLKSAKEKGAILMYDPNFRKAHYNRIEELKPKFLQYFNLADAVRGSDEDFMGIYNAGTFNELLKVFPNKQTTLVYTSVQQGVSVKSGENTLSFSLPKIEPVSTIGAGDTFNAGIIFGLLQHNISKSGIHHISKDVLEKIISRAIEFSSHVCLSEDNYLSREFCKGFKI